VIRDVTLSFDNGPTPGVTEPVLDALRRHGIRATFFVLGKKIVEPSLKLLARQAHDEGHWIGNHTYSHGLPLGQRADDRAAPENEIGETQSLLGALAHPSRFFRPNGGGGVLGPHLLSRDAADFLERGQFTCVLWNAIPRDWDDPAGWVETALAQCRALPWSLVVLHDLPTGAMARLDAFITRACAEGARFRQEFPPDCLPMIEGKPAPGLDAFIARGS
jgi:peptidoglycan-N-acetylglucosamine deacetylase